MSRAHRKLTRTWRFSRITFMGTKAYARSIFNSMKEAALKPKRYVTVVRMPHRVVPIGSETDLGDLEAFGGQLIRVEAQTQQALRQKVARLMKRSRAVGNRQAEEWGNHPV